MLFSKKSVPKKILFICKQNESYSTGSYTGYTKKWSGLFNSTRFIVESLQSQKVQAKIVQVIDNNSIDKEVTNYKPDIVVIEALWVVPEKFAVLKKLHPKVDWFVHMHSGVPFLAQEGIAMDWLYRYSNIYGVGVIANSQDTANAFKLFIPKNKLIYLPNIYLSAPQSPVSNVGKKVINIGCFGAIRPLKNQLLQALAAIQFAEEQGLPLRFHMNVTRVEAGGNPVLANIKALFSNIKNAELVEHPWMEPTDFLTLLHNEIDLGMQVSLSETWNVVSSDYVTAGLPVVASKEVYWLSEFSTVKSNSIQDIVETMYTVWNNPLLTKLNQFHLSNSSKQAQKLWFNFVSN